MTMDEVREILAQIKYLDWKLEVRCHEENLKIPDFLFIRFDAKCTTTGEDKGWTSRKWKLSQYMVKSEIVTTAFKAVMTAIEHEARESFLYKEKAIFGPHFDVDALVSICQSDDVLDVRKSP